MYLELCVVFLCALLVTHWASWRGFIGPKKNLPPSYYGFPLVGVLPFMLWNKKHLSMAREITKQRGPVFRLRIGWIDVVMANGSTTVKEVLKNDDFLGRPKIAVFELIRKVMGADPFIAMEGEKWKTLRNFSVHALKDLGLGKTPIMESKIQEEIQFFLDHIGSAQNAPQDPRQPLLSSVSNNIATLVFGDRLPYEHPRRRDFNNFLLGFLQAASYFVVIGFVPILMNFLVFIGIKPAQRFLEVADKAKAAFKRETDEHIKNFDENDKRDFMDQLLSKQKEDPNTFTPRVVQGACVVFFGAGSNTTRISVEYLLHLCVAYPHLQEQMHQEIIRNVGDARLPCWADKDKLHLVNAFIQERHRIFSIAPLGVFRRAMRDTKLGGYDIPQGTMIIYNVDSVHHDETVFDNPDDFNPSRFLDAEGKFIQSNNIIPFAIGKRACPGEAFATFEMFLYFTAILQRYRVEVPKGAEVKLSRAEQFFSEPIQQPLVFISRS